MNQVISTITTIIMDKEESDEVGGLGIRTIRDGVRINKKSTAITQPDEER